MVWIKRIDNPLGDTGDSTHVGTDHWDLNDKYHDNVDVSASLTNPTKINTPTSFRDQILKILNAGSTAAYTIKAGTISSDVDLSLPDLAGPGTLVAAGGANDWGTAAQTFRSTYLLMRNPANSASYIHTTSAIAGNRVVTWPLLTSDDEVVFKAFAQDLTSKTININQNTIKHSTTNAEGDILIYSAGSGLYTRLPRGTADQLLSIAADGNSVLWADPPEVDVEESVDFPIPTVDSINYGVWYGTTVAGGSGIWSNLLFNTSTITPATIIDTSGRIGMRYNFTNDDDVGGFRTTSVFFTRQNDPEIWVRYKYDPLSASHSAGTSYRVVIGFVSDVAADYGSDGAVNNKSAMLWFKETADTSIQVGRNDGDATADKDATVSVSQTNSSIHTIRIFADNANSRFGVSLDGASTTYYTTEIPAATTRLGCIVQFENEGSDDRSFEIYGSYFKCKII